MMINDSVFERNRTNRALKIGHLSKKTDTIFAFFREMQTLTVIAPEILIAIPQPHRRAAVRAVHRTTITAEAFHTQGRISPLSGSPYRIAGRT